MLYPDKSVFRTLNVCNVVPIAKFVDHGKDNVRVSNFYFKIFVVPLS